MAKQKAVVVRIQRDKWSRGSKIRNALYIDQATVDDAATTIAGDQDKSRVPLVSTMCCLGFACKTLGVHIDDMAGIGMPDSLSADAKELVASAMLKEVYRDTDEIEHAHNQQWVNDAQEVNDAKLGEHLNLHDVDDEETDEDGLVVLKSELHREQLIIQLFAVGGLVALFE